MATAFQKFLNHGWILLAVGIGYCLGSPEPLVSQGGLMPIRPSSGTVPVAETEVEETKLEKPNEASLKKRQGEEEEDAGNSPPLKGGTSALTEQQLNLLLSSFPNEAASSPDSPSELQPTFIPSVILTNDGNSKSKGSGSQSESFQTFYYDQPPSPASFSVPLVDNKTPPKVESVKINNETYLRVVDTVFSTVTPAITVPEPPPAPENPRQMGRNMDADVVVPNEVKAEAIEKDIFAQSLKEDINRKVDQTTERSEQSSAIDNNLLLMMRQTGKRKGAPEKKNVTEQNAPPKKEEENEGDPDKISLFEQPIDMTVKKKTGSGIPAYKPGPPWEDEKIIGKLKDETSVPALEISHKVATKLCMARKRVATQPPFVNKQARYYLWAPINQYVPLIHKGYPIRPPVFAPQCLKWVIRPCRGVLRRPLVKPCTYWAPMPIRRPECGFLPNIQSKIVNYRPPEFVPGNCPCVWPCTKRFDPIQRCRVETAERERHLDAIHSDGDPWHEGEFRLQDLLVTQLCRGMKLALSMKTVVPIGWIPMRIESIDRSSDPEEEGAPPPDSETEPGTQFRRKRDLHSLSKRGVKGRKSAVFDKKKRQIERQPVRNNKFYNPDAVLEPNNQLTGRNLDDEENDETKFEELDDDILLSFAEVASYDPDQYRVKPEEDTDKEIGTCIEWKYKACPKGKSSEEIHSALLEQSADGNGTTTREGKKGLRRRSSSTNRRHKRRRIQHLEREAVRHKRENEDDEDSNLFNAMGRQGNEIGVCGEWHYSETTHCIVEERVGIAARISEIMLTGVIESRESEEDDEDELTEGMHKVEIKTVKNLCPGSPAGFPCFLRRRRRDAEDEAKADEGNDEDAEKTEGDEGDDTDGPDETGDDDDTETEQKGEEPPVPAGEDSDKLITSVYYANKIQTPLDSACMCDWPCLPFFDKINHCYNLDGSKYQGEKKRFRSFRRSQRSPVACLNFVETDEIYCKVKDKQE